jgi:acyl-CoA thioesterase FadM
VHGFTQRLTLDVPKRDIDAAQALNDRAFLAVIAKARVDFVPEPLGPERVLTDEQRLHAVDDGGIDAGRPVALAPAY